VREKLRKVEKTLFVFLPAQKHPVFRVTLLKSKKSRKERKAEKVSFEKVSQDTPCLSMLFLLKTSLFSTSLLLKTSLLQPVLRPLLSSLFKKTGSSTALRKPVSVRYMETGFSKVYGNRLQ